MSGIVQSKPWTLTEFLECENSQETKHEFLAGEIIAITGGTFAHARLIARLLTRLSNHLDQTPCLALASDLKVQSAENILYPDVIVTCLPQENDDLICKHPKLIIEVLSGSTASRDRNKKRHVYQHIETLEQRRHRFQRRYTYFRSCQSVG